MKAKFILVVGLVVVVGCVVASMVILRRSAPGTDSVGAPVAVEPQTPSVPAPPEPLLVEALTVSGENTPARRPERAGARTNSIPQQAAASTSQSSQPGQKLQDPLAREAMALVGVDSGAEEYWLDAINDPSLSDNEREDLIEDLNENGYSADNGRRATVDDLWLIARRIEIVEELWSYAMDQNNWNAFQEVYKDLWNMYYRLGGQ